VMFGVANGLTMANSIVGAVKAAGVHAGSATGLVGATQMLSGAVFSSLAIALNGDIYFANAMAVVIGLSLISALSAYLALDPASRMEGGTN
jgi:sugar phosphate permease